MSFYTLAIFTGTTHDGSMCLLEDDQIILLVAGERITREKHTNLTTRAVQNILKEIKGITNYIDLVVVTSLNESGPALFHSPITKKDVEQLLSEEKFTYGKIIWDSSNHHLYHAAAAFYTSGFEDAGCIIIDGQGSQWPLDDQLVAETTTLFDANNKLIKTVFKQLVSLKDPNNFHPHCIEKFKSDFDSEISITNNPDIGALYGIVTIHLGLGLVFDSGKTMGLSAYGETNELEPIFIPGTIISNPNMFLLQAVDQHTGVINVRQFEMTDVVKKNLAFNIQKALELVFVKRMKELQKAVNSRNVVLGGGCAANILANSLIKKTFPTINIWVDPIAGDATQSLGAALYHYKRMFPNTKFKKLGHLFLGPEYSIVDTKDKLLKLVEQYNNESSLPVNSNQ